MSCAKVGNTGIDFNFFSFGPVMPALSSKVKEVTFLFFLVKCYQNNKLCMHILSWGQFPSNFREREYLFQVSRMLILLARTGQVILWKDSVSNFVLLLFLQWVIFWPWTISHFMATLAFLPNKVAILSFWRVGNTAWENTSNIRRWRRPWYHDINIRNMHSSDTSCIFHKSSQHDNQGYICPVMEIFAVLPTHL